jgi:restriction system protein
MHHSRVFFRHAANGLFISASGFTDPAVAHAKLALTRMVSVLCELEEIVFLLGGRGTSDYPRKRDLPANLV